MNGSNKKAAREGLSVKRPTLVYWQPGSVSGSYARHQLIGPVGRRSHPPRPSQDLLLATSAEEYMGEEKNTFRETATLPPRAKRGK